MATEEKSASQGKAGGTKQARSRRHRAQIVRTAIRLFRRKGYAGTGLQEILTASGAPKGSLYYYFPGGKEELGAEAVRAACQVVEQTLEKLATESKTPGAFVSSYMKLLAGWMEASDFRDGCPIATTLLETVPDSELISEAGRQGLDSWVEVIARVFSSLPGDSPYGQSPEGQIESARAYALARTVVAAIEGSLLMARTARSTAPFEAVESTLVQLLDSSTEGHP